MNLKKRGKPQWLDAQRGVTILPISISANEGCLSKSLCI